MLARLYQDDGLYEGGAAAALRLPMFTGNHDFGRLAWIIRAARPNATDDEVLKRVMLANAMMFLLRGVPVVYYGDEQGFVGHGIDQDARQDLFASQVASYNDQTLLGTLDDDRGGELQSAASAVRADRRPREAAPGAAGAAARPADRARAWQGAGVVRRIAPLGRWPSSSWWRSTRRHATVVAQIEVEATSVVFRSLARRLRGQSQRARQFPRGSAAVELRRLPGSGAVKLGFRARRRSGLWAAPVGKCAGGVQPASDASIRSPGGILAVSLRVNGEGRPEYSIVRNGQTLVNWSRLGFILADAPKLERNFELERVEQKAIDDTWEQPWGERRYVRNHCTELRVTLREKTGAPRNLTVVFRVFDDGVGFRYEFPEQPSLTQVNIVEELTEFDIAEPATAWWIPGGEWNRYEYLYQKTPLTEVAQAHTPLTLKTASGVHIAIHEAALVDYSAMWLRRVSGQRLKAVLSPSSSGPAVSRKAPFVTPWRTLQIASSAPGLYMSDLILNLNEPNKLGDVSWVKPFKYVGIWWGMHLGTKTWASGPKHGATTAETKRYIDFAAQHGFRGVLVEGWNKGWDGDWFAKGDDFSFTEAYPDFDIVALAAYAKKKGVHLVGHHETAGNIAVYEKQLGAALDLYAKLGIDAVKTGYVADAGGVQALGADGRIHFEWHDGQVQARHHLHVVEEAAKRHIAVNAA